MASRDLLARLTFALAAVSTPIVACGGETTDGNAGQSGATGGSTQGKGGSVSAGAGGSVASAGAAGENGTGGTLGIACDRPLPPKGPSGFGDGCRLPSDCSSKGESCLRPGESVCSFDDEPPQPSCVSDAACDQGTDAWYVCQENDGAASTCQLACSGDTSCAVDRFCNAKSGHCEPRSCSPDAAPCPTNTFCAADFKCRPKLCDVDRPCGTGLACRDFSCEPQGCTSNPATNGGCPDTFACTLRAGDAVCLRRSCVCDTQCGASGFCLGGTCFETAGSCSGNVDCGRPLLVDGAPLVAPLLGVAWA